jgi:ATP-dependent RNA helicase DDX27
MAVTTKRKLEDDFIFTISDNEENSIPNFDEEIALSPPPASKKRKHEGDPANPANPALEKKTKKKRSKNENKSKPDVVGNDNEGFWGAKDEDDRAMNSDFEFPLEAGTDERLDEFEGWGFEGAKKSLDVKVGDKKVVDIDEIIARRRQKKGSGKDMEVEGAEKADNGSRSESESLEGDTEGMEFLDAGDEFIAEDGFGMGVPSDEVESGDENQLGESSEGEQDEGNDNYDDDSVASPAPHPDDLASEGSSDEDDTDEDQVEAARREAFFAPEEKPVKGAKQVSTLSFQNMQLSRPILRGLAAVGFTQPTPIQAKTIPVALLGKDVVGGAVTGSGKTAAFIVPVLERLLYRPKKVPTSRVVILMPTRELAIQCHAVATKLASHTDIKFCLAVGGLSLKVQEAELRLRPDVIIATPGRFIDHMRNSASFTVDTLEILVLDEADRMLEAGFADELNEILTTIPKSRQTMLFSATMTSSVDNLIRVGLNKPVRLLVDSQNKTVSTLVQEFIRLRPGRETKRMGYLLYLCTNVYSDRVIVFFRQKKEAHRARVVFSLSGLKATELHGSMSQEQVSDSIAWLSAYIDIHSVLQAWKLSVMAKRPFC